MLKCGETYRLADMATYRTALDQARAQMDADDRCAGGTGSGGIPRLQRALEVLECGHEPIEADDGLQVGHIVLAVKSRKFREKGKNSWRPYGCLSDLLKLVERKAAPVEDTRVADAWARADARAASAKLDRDEMKAIKALPSKIETITDVVDNPDFSRDHPEGKYGNIRRIPATRNIKESAISTLEARGLLHPAQVRAAERFRKFWEQTGGAGAGAMDYTREPVDGGGYRDPISDRLVTAAQELDRCRVYIGLRGYRLVAAIAGEGRSIEEVAGPSQRARYSTTDALRGHLEDLAVMWLMTNYAQPDRIAVRK